jgi:uncharacterized DUF497 family protein
VIQVAVVVTTKWHYTREAVLIFEWNERKRLNNLRKHGIDFAECAGVFAGPIATLPDNRFEYGEERYIAYGMLNGEIVAVAFTETNQAVRVISMRKASRREQAFYFQAIQN